MPLSIACLIGSALMLKKQLRISSWGRNLRMALATVLVFWTFVEVAARNGFFNEIRVDPLNHITEMVINSVLLWPSTIYSTIILGTIISMLPSPIEHGFR